MTNKKAKIIWIFTLITGLLVFSCSFASGVLQRGDANLDSRLDLGDAIKILQFLFNNGPAPAPIELADVNSDGIYSISDPIFLLRYIFSNGPAPVFLEEKKIQVFENADLDTLLNCQIILKEENGSFTGFKLTDSFFKDEQDIFDYNLYYLGKEPDTFLSGYDIKLKISEEEEWILAEERFFESQAQEPQIGMTIEEIQRELLSGHPRSPTPELLSNLTHLLYKEGHNQGLSDAQISETIQVRLKTLEGRVFDRCETTEAEREFVYHIIGLVDDGIGLDYYITIQKQEVNPPLIDEIIQQLQNLQEQGKISSFEYRLEDDKIHYLFTVYDVEGHAAVETFRVNALDPPQQEKVIELIKARISYWKTSIKMGEVLFVSKDKKHQRLIKKEELKEVLLSEK